MIYTSIISLIEKPFYLLRPQSFSFHSVRVYRYICEVFTLYVPGVGLLTLCSLPRGGFLYTIIVPGGGKFLLPSSCVLGVCPGRGMVMDEIDTCISFIWFYKHMFNNWISFIWIYKHIFIHGISFIWIYKHILIHGISFIWIYKYMFIHGISFIWIYKHMLLHGISFIWIYKHMFIHRISFIWINKYI